MTKELFKEFKSEPLAFLYSDELNIRIRHADFENLQRSYEPNDKGTLYVVQKRPNSIKNVTCYMTEHMILKAFKKDTFEIGMFQVGI